MNKYDTFHGNITSTPFSSNVSMKIGVVRAINERDMTATIIIPQGGSSMMDIPISGMFQFSGGGNLQYPAIGSQVIIVSSPPLRPFVLCSVVGRNAITDIDSDILKDEQLFSTTKQSIIKQDTMGGICVQSSNKNSILASNDGVKINTNSASTETPYYNEKIQNINGTTEIYQKIKLNTKEYPYYLPKDIPLSGKKFYDLEESVLGEFDELSSLLSNKIKECNIHVNTMFPDLSNTNDVSLYKERISDIFDSFIDAFYSDELIVQSGSVFNKDSIKLNDKVKVNNKGKIEINGSECVYQISFKSSGDANVVIGINKKGEVYIPNLLK